MSNAANANTYYARATCISHVGDTFTFETDSRIYRITFKHLIARKNAKYPKYEALVLISDFGGLRWKEHYTSDGAIEDLEKEALALVEKIEKRFSH